MQRSVIDEMVKKVLTSKSLTGEMNTVEQVEAALGSDAGRTIAGSFVNLDRSPTTYL
ncbi:MAG: hypothetical protein NT024_09220 [Proteobacteria bacterium]|nr:hypothetical protein [Pseudomonadota bacterium]